MQILSELILNVTVLVKKCSEPLKIQFRALGR